MPELEAKVILARCSAGPDMARMSKIKATMSICRYTSPDENMTYMASKVHGIQKVLLKMENLWRTLDAMYVCCFTNLWERKFHFRQVRCTINKF